MAAIDAFRPKVPLRASDTEGYSGVRGTSGRTRTGTLLRARDFESRVSTNSTTLAFSICTYCSRAAIIAVINSGSTDLTMTK